MHEQMAPPTPNLTIAAPFPYSRGAGVTAAINHVTQQQKGS
jgi:hypothetical protein